jgi:tetratricopeptide (TPR) repeat protein
MGLPLLTRSALLLCGLALAPVACLASPAASAVAPSPGGAAADARGPSWPATLADVPTTAGDIYLGNLDARIAVLEAALGRTGLASAARAQLRTSLAGALYHRYRIRATLPDAEAALAALDAALADAPGDAAAFRLRATMRAGFHDFDGARADLSAARAAGASPDSLAEAEREIALGTGRYDLLAEPLATSTRADGDLYALAFRGNLRLQQGDLAGASAQFRRAQALYSDSSPVPLAWLHLQQGIALLRHGRHAEANSFFRAAHERLPGYTLATEHLAETEVELGRIDAARALYERVIADTGSPEFLDALAGLERAAGNAARAAELDARAAAGWDAWVARHPSAFAQHAIPYYLEQGKPARALELAKANIALRQDVGSWILLAQAADAAGDAPLACSARGSALATGLQPPELGEIASLAAPCAERMAATD